MEVSTQADSVSSSEAPKLVVEARRPVALDEAARHRCWRLHVQELRLGGDLTMAMLSITKTSDSATVETADVVGAIVTTHDLDGPGISC